MPREEQGLQPTFRVFLSHRYKSPKVNRWFFELLASHGQLQFEVDTSTKATNVTRLERSVRSADAFVGIYPFPSDDDARPDRETALRASRYFRLELDLAARSRKSGIAFVDGRYGTAITVPSTIREVRYDHQEVMGPLAGSRSASLRDHARQFRDEVGASTSAWGPRTPSTERDRVGICVPHGNRAKGAYSRHDIEQLEERLRSMSLKPVHLDWQVPVDGSYMRELLSLDWVVMDIGASACSTGLPGFLHGLFVPQVRVLRSRPGASAAESPMEATLLGAFEVGYSKDIVRWSASEDLDREFVERLTTLYEPRKYVKTPDEAREYFAGAALRAETVFLSYSGEDREAASRISRALRARFQQVFDYRDQGESIVPGRSWIDEVFGKLSTSAIGVPLLSESYLRKGNCVHEAEEMVARVDAGSLRMIPVKLREEELQLPPWLAHMQYVRGWEYSTPEALVERLVSAYDASSKAD